MLSQAVDCLIYQTDDPIIISGVGKGSRGRFLIDVNTTSSEVLGGQSCFELRVRGSDRHSGFASMFPAS